MTARLHHLETTYDNHDCEIELRIAFTVIPGSPETGPSYASGGDPATDAEIEIADIRVMDGASYRVASPAEFAVYSEWAMENQFDEMLAEACEDDTPDPDDARDQDRDDRMMGFGAVAALVAGPACLLAIAWTFNVLGAVLS